MLIITRRAGQKIMLGDDITLHVMEIVGNSVRVGIAAPKSLPVYREAPVYRRPRYERQVYYRPAPRCHTRMEQHWDGWSWVERPRRFCP